MSIRLTKPWRPLDVEEIARLTGQLGVYEVADLSGRVLYIGRADARSRFGLRGELEAQFVRRGPGCRFRVEVNMQYHTRQRELLMVHRADHGELPPDNDPSEVAGGRLSPAG